MKKSIISVVLLCFFLSYFVYYFINQPLGFHIHYISQKSTLVSKLSEYWLKTCPDISIEETEPNSVLGSVVAGREMLDTKFSIVLKTMIDCGHDIEQRDSIGFTPLHAAILYSDSIAVKALLDLGANKRSILINRAATKFGELTSIEFASQLNEPNEVIVDILKKLP